MAYNYSIVRRGREMDSESALNAIKSTGIVAGMRGAFPPAVALRVSEVLMNEGITVFEMMMNSEAPIAAMTAPQSRIRR